VPHKDRQRHTAYMRKWRAENIGKMRQYQRATRAKGTNKRGLARYRSTVKGGAMYAVRRAEKRAKQKGLPFNLTREWMELKLIAGLCEVSGIPFQDVGPASPSIDRVIPSRGYIQTNCRVVLWCINAAFGDWGEDYTRQIWTRILGAG
jgi:hypothetical protein